MSRANPVPQEAGPVLRMVIATSAGPQWLEVYRPLPPYELGVQQFRCDLVSVQIEVEIARERLRLALDREMKPVHSPLWVAPFDSDMPQRPLHDQTGGLADEAPVAV